MAARSTRRTTAAHTRTAAVGAIAVAGTLPLTGCGEQTQDNGSKTAKTSAAPAADQLPM